MNEETHKSNSFISEQISEKVLTVSTKDVATSTDTFLNAEDGEASSSTEDDTAVQCAPKKCKKDYIDPRRIDREPMFVIVDSSCLSSPSSREILIDNKIDRNTVYKRHLNKSILPIDMPSTSRDDRLVNSLTNIRINSDSKDELEMIEINLQSENEITLDENETDNESIVISYLRNKDAFLDMEGTLLSTKKKSSLLQSVPKMETILEGEQFSSFPISSKCELAPNAKTPESKEK